MTPDMDALTLLKAKSSAMVPLVDSQPNYGELMADHGIKASS
jgi:hypothetical protein